LSFTVIVPARYASTRFPGKPLIDLGGKPMVVRVAERAAQSAASRVVVATDDARIAQACARHQVAVVMTASTHATGTDRLSEAAHALGLRDDDVVVNVQGDEPLIPAEVINDVASLLVSKPQAAIATVCHPIHDVAEVFNPNVVKVVLNQAGDALYFSRAPIPFARDAYVAGPPTHLPQGLPVYRHVGLYAYRVGFLKAFPQLAPATIEHFEALEQLRALAHGYAITVRCIDAPLPPGVDTPADYEAMKHRFK
jgi:3-deoxy-manno-octulosonate cytidylyltransferase (CMP-KDO synthetase)